VRALARGGGMLLAVRRPRPIAASLADASYPDSWEAAKPGLPIPVGGGALSVRVRAPVAGDYSVWLRGSLKSEGRLEIDGEEVGRVRHVLNNQGQYIRFGSVALDRGGHEVRLTVAGADLHPGSGGQLTPIGPMVLSRAEAKDARIERVAASDAQRLCGGRYDWLEVAP
jgi:hypothetical protein